MAPIIPEKCPLCGEIFSVGGPLWCGEMYNSKFVTTMINEVIKLPLKTEEKALKLLNICLNEANAPIGYYEIHKICKNLKTSAPPLLDVMDRLKNEGYFVSRTHFSPTSLKTDADVVKLKQIIMKLKD